MNTVVLYKRWRVGCKLQSHKREEMKGFMCQSVEATAICTMADPRSVVVPRRPDKTLVENTRLLRDGGRYTRLPGSAQYSSSKQQFGHANSTFKRSSTVLVPYNGRELEVMNMKMMKKKKNTASSAPLPIKQMPLNSTTGHVFRVVVMKVSLHCQGCAGKVKKHISKMEGVTSYSIDLETKRVTVMGHVSPDGVLESISKVKRAEFWPSCGY